MASAATQGTGYDDQFMAVMVGAGAPISQDADPFPGILLCAGLALSALSRRLSRRASRTPTARRLTRGWGST